MPWNMILRNQLNKLIVYIIFLMALRNRADYVFENPFPNTTLSVKEEKHLESRYRFPFSELSTN